MARLPLAFSLLFISTAACGDDSIAIAALSDRLDHAIVARDVAAAGSLYCEDFVLTTSGGNIKRKAEMLSDISSESLRFEINSTQETLVRVRGDTAVLMGVLHQKGRSEHLIFDNRFRVTYTWLRENDRWCLLAEHASLIARKPYPATLPPMA